MEKELLRLLFCGEERRSRGLELGGIDLSPWMELRWGREEEGSVGKIVGWRHGQRPREQREKKEMEQRPGDVAPWRRGGAELPACCSPWERGRREVEPRVGGEDAMGREEVSCAMNRERREEEEGCGGCLGARGRSAKMSPSAREGVHIYRGVLGLGFQMAQLGCNGLSPKS
jgi:hypothetical protein